MAAVDPSQLTPEYLAEDQRRTAYIAIAVTTAVSFLVVLLRTYSRICIVKIFGPDDWIICIAMVCRCPALLNDPTTKMFTGSQHRYDGAFVQST